MRNRGDAYFDFTNEVVQESRFRQLFNNEYQSVNHILPLSIPGLIETNALIYLEFIPYRIWSKGLINPLKAYFIHQEAKFDRFTVHMGDNPDISEVIKVIDGLFGDISE